jgi:S1-C subfamily serine protease
VKKAIDDFIASGKIRYGWLGVSLLQADEAMLKELGAKDRKGALASQIFMGSPADKGGMLPGDFVVALNGKDVKSVDQLVRDVGDLSSGDTVTFRIIRGGKEQTLTVKIDERNETIVSDATRLWPGFMPIPLNEEISKRLNLASGQQGVAVSSVQAKSPAAVIGLQPGDVITAVNDKDVKGLADFYARLSDRSGKEIWFDVIREGQKVSTMRYKR